MKSPSQNSPLPSMKKQRSASPSQAIPRSAPVARTRSMIIRRFSSSSGFGSWSGNSPSGTKYISSSSSGSCSRIGPTIGPAIPLPPSTTTFIGFTLAGSMKESAWARNSSQTSTSSSRAAAGRVRRARPRSRALTSPIPASPESGSAPSRTSFTPV